MAAEPLFIDGSAGRLFALHHPADAGSEHPALVFVPPFAEEMNRARRMVAVQARALASAGIASLILDPTGTGDSDGAFAEARWETWRADVGRAVGWLRRRGHARIGLWGLRLGALLAAEIAHEPETRIDTLLLWAPVADGKQHLTQFLRIRVAAGLTRSADERETTEQLRTRLAAGEALEVAGYALAPALAAAIDGRALAPLAPAAGCRVVWFDLGEATAGPPPASARVIERWRADGAAIEAGAVADPSFWATVETTVAPALVAATVAALRTRVPA